MRGVLSPSIPLRDAYGVSCRARVSIYATPHVWRFAPAAWAALGPPILGPVGWRTRRDGGKLTDLPAKCVTEGGVKVFLPTERGAPTAGRVVASRGDAQRCDRWTARPRAAPPPAV